MPLVKGFMFAEEFWTINIGHVIQLAAFSVASCAYFLNRQKDSKDRAEARDKMIETQTKMHSENQSRLDVLARFHNDQTVINGKRDQQIQELATQTALLTQLTQIMDRRLQSLESRSA
jgi:chromatin segregation and condensation protein Rec8/ScpA/Scc1 (kleisin family)